MLTNFKRILNFAFNDFYRNKGISVAAIFVLSVSMMVITCLFFFQGMSRYLTSEIQNKIDITAYFKNGTSEQEILAVKDEVLKMSSGIKGIEYVSKEQALELFNEKHKDNPVLSKALEEVGDNPFLPSLNITTNGEPAQYAEISNIMQSADFSGLIEKIDFSQKKDTIEKVYSITSNVNLFGILAEIVLVIIAMLIVFNTLKLGIENSKEEIATMRVVGASNWFIRGPFVMQGILYGIIAFLICFVMSGLFAYLASPKISVLLPGFHTLSYFLTNSWILVLIQLAFGIGVGAVSSLIVVKKYLEI